MKQILKNKAFIVLFLILGLFIISLTWYLVSTSSSAVRVLFFPNNRTLGVSGEERRLYKNKDKESKYLQVLEELSLGPVEIDHGRILPKNISINSLVFRGGSLYIDFSEDILIFDADVRLSLMEILGIVSKTYFYNYPGIKTIYYSILGEPVKVSAKGSL